MTSEDIHHYKVRLGATVRRISEDTNLRPEDKQLILDFLQHCAAQGMSDGRRFKLGWMLHSLAKQMPCSFKQAKCKDIEKLVAWINSATIYTPNRKSDLKRCVKQGTTATSDMAT